MPSAQPAPHGPTAGVTTSTQCNQGTYAPGPVDPRSTQALSPEPAGGVECQPGTPVTGYGANSLNIAAQGLSILSLGDQLKHYKQS